MPLLPSLDLHFRIRVDGTPPDLPFLGPTVRGLIGYGLRETCCGHPAGDDGRCALAEACPYAFLFEGPAQRRLEREGLVVDALPQPFVPLVEGPRECEPRGGWIDFGIRLFGRAVGLAGRVAAAVRAREPHGFGARSSGYLLASASVGGREAWRRESDPHAERLERAVTDASLAESGRGRLERPHPVVGDGPHTALRWTFLTPVSLAAPMASRNGLEAARLLLQTVGRRAWLLERAYPLAGGDERVAPPAIPRRAFVMADRALEPFVCARRSTRHGRTVVLKGEFGAATIVGPWHRHADLVDAARTYALGRHASFGFGRVEIDAVPLPARFDASHSNGDASSDARLDGAGPTARRRAGG
jgi:hypothetical protein